MFISGKKDNEIQTVDLHVSNRTIFRILIMVVVTLVLLSAIKTALPTFISLFTAIFLALALNGPVQSLAKRLPGKNRNNRTLATSFSFVIIALVLTGFLLSIVPPIIRQTDNLISSAPDIVRQTKDSNTTIGKFVQKYHLENQVEEFSSDLSGRLKEATGTAVATASKVGSSIFTLLTILVLAFMMLIEGPRWIAFFKDLIPDKHHQAAERISGQMYKVIRGYVNGQVMLAAIAAMLILPMMIVLDISYPFALMFIVFICGLIPMVGHTIGAIIVTFIALFTSPLAALIILSYYILYQQIENYFVQPKVQANSTNMSPLLVFASVIIGAQFGGLFGGLVAIPVAGCVRILLLEYLYHKRIIEHPEKNPVTNTKAKTA